VRLVALKLDVCCQNGGWAGPWLNGITNILQTLAKNGGPACKVKGLAQALLEPVGRSRSGAGGDKHLWVLPGFINPITDAGEIAICGRNQARPRSRRLIL